MPIFPPTIPILMYHNIDVPPKNERLSSLYTHPSQFARQMKVLSLMGYQGLSMRQLYPYLMGENEGGKIGKVVGITFDDGYLDNYEHALSVLQKYHFSATCFVVAERIGKTNIWSHGKNIREAPLMNRDHINAWIKAGMDIGSHTSTHVHLTQIADELAKEEIFGSKKRLEDTFSIAITDFCYPYGEFNQKTYSLVKEAKYQTACSTQRKRSRRDDDVLILPRVHMARRTTLLLFLAKLLTSYEDKRFEKNIAYLASLNSDELGRGGTPNSESRRGTDR